jgi:Ca-activated chloride channel family protein
MAATADSGVLVPTDKQAPDPAILSLSEMQVDIHVDNGDARVWVRQVFVNHTNRPQEGNYLFALPGGTTISDFAVWDGPVRIPAVILERKRPRTMRGAVRSSARISFPFPLTEPSGWRLSITNTFPCRRARVTFCCR